MFELLLDHGSNVDSIIDSTEDLTFLMYFCGLENTKSQVLLDSIKFLLEHGADRTKKNRFSKNAFDFVEKNPLKENVLFLLNTVKKKYDHKKENGLKKVINVDLGEAELTLKNGLDKDCQCVVL